MSDSLPITALFASIRGFDDARPALEHLVGQTLAAGGEVIVADGSGEPAPTDEQMAAVGGPIVWLSMPGSSVYQLRLAAYQASRGEIVAVTEDHCYVAPDWIERILAAHAAFPEAGVIGGSVQNGTDRRSIDWAAFFLTQGPFMVPLENGLTDRVSGAANCSYKRRVIERLGGDAEQGVIDFLELPEALEGERLAADDSIRVLHHQSPGFARLSLAEFDNGRTIAGYRRREMERGDWIRIATASVLPLYRSVRAMRIVGGKERPPRARLKAAPAHVWFQYCAIVGELIGYAAGPGDSPKRLY